MPELEELDPEKTVEVFPQDLEDIRDTLSSVYHFCLSYDLFNQYKNLSNKIVLSPLTKEIKKMQTRIATMIEETEEEDVS